MIAISQLSMPVPHTEEMLRSAICKALHIGEKELISYSIRKQSIDARKKEELHYSYQIAAEVTQEERCLKRLDPHKFSIYKPRAYQYQITGEKPLTNGIVIVGAGPAGLVLAYQLAKEGYHPTLLERGKCVEERVQDVDAFFAGGELNPESNVQFGEGGAGTFSDGKLNTLVKDKDGKCAYLMQLFANMGAPEEITYRNKPHIGTDRLRTVVKNLRQEIIANGGTVRFSAKVTGICTKPEEGQRVLCGVQLEDGETIPCDAAVFAIGHSARDTFEMLEKLEIPMERKAFAMGIRVQHARKWVDRLQYGSYADKLPAADYKLTHTLKDGRGVYTFCMCPGGYVVNASSEPGRLAINGMSDFARDSDNSNSAVVVTITPEEYEALVPDQGVLGGMYYQRKLEELAYRTGRGNVPTQRYADFVQNCASTDCGSIAPVNRGAVAYTNLRECLPPSMTEALLEGLAAFDRQMPGFADPDTLLSAIESRTSSPVRILRNEEMESVVAGFYPCGEGAGYAGGITSAAMDGLRVFEALIKKYKRDR